MDHPVWTNFKGSKCIVANQLILGEPASPHAAPPRPKQLSWSPIPNRHRSQSQLPRRRPYTSPQCQSQSCFRSKKCLAAVEKRNTQYRSMRPF